MTPVTLPMVVFDERRAINRTALAVASVHRALSKEYSREL